MFTLREQIIQMNKEETTLTAFDQLTALTGLESRWKSCDKEIDGEVDLYDKVTRSSA